METRTVIEIKVWILILNPMTDRVESGRVAAIAFDKQSLMEFYHNEFAEEAYEDGRFQKAFKKDGPLEWFNPVMGEIGDPPQWHNHGISYDWIYEETLEELKGRFHFIS